MVYWQIYHKKHPSNSASISWYMMSRTPRYCRQFFPWSNILKVFVGCSCKLLQSTEHLFTSEKRHLTEMERGRFIQCNTNQCLVQASQKHDQRDYLSKELAAIFGKFVEIKCSGCCVKNNKETFTTGTGPLYIPDEFQLLICSTLKRKKCV